MVILQRDTRGFSSIPLEYTSTRDAQTTAEHDLAQYWTPVLARYAYDFFAEGARSRLRDPYRTCLAPMALQIAPSWPGITAWAALGRWDPLRGRSGSPVPRARTAPRLIPQRAREHARKRASR